MLAWSWSTLFIGGSKTRRLLQYMSLLLVLPVLIPALPLLLLLPLLSLQLLILLFCTSALLFT